MCVNWVALLPGSNPTPKRSINHRGARYFKSKLRDPDGQVREQTVRAIGDIGSPAAVKLLVECLEAREDPHVMPTAVGVLAEIGTAEALDGLVATLSGENRAGLQYVVSALSGAAIRGSFRACSRR